MKKRGIQVFVCVCLVALPIIISGQTFSDPSQALNLQDCMDYAVSHSTSLERQREAVLKSRLDLRDASLSLVPSIGVGGSAGYSFGRTNDPVSNAYTNVRQFSQGLDVSASMPLFAGLSGIFRIQVAKYSAQMSRCETERLANEIALEVLRLYYEVLYRRGLWSLAEAQLRRTEKEASGIRLQGELGLKSQSDLADAEAKLSNDVYLQIVGKNAYESALLSLKAQMNYPMSRALVLDSSELTPVLSVAYSYTSDSLLRLAQGHLPEWANASLDIKRAQAAYRQMVGVAFPRFSLNGGYGTQYFDTYRDENQMAIPYGTQFINNANQYVSVSMNFPIFSGLQQHNRIRRARADWRIAEAQQRELEQTLYRDVELALHDWEASVREFSQAQKRVVASGVSLRVNTQKYAEGLVGILDYHASANLYLQAQAEALRSYLLMNQKQRYIDFYAGQTLITVDPFNQN